MFQVVEAQRRSPVLSQPSLPCLSQHYTINLTAGCPNRCRYCYAQSFSQHPGWGKVVFYANSLELLRQELLRRRAAPRLVFLSTACEPFAPDERILECLYGIVELLLSRRVFVLVSTKCLVPAEFLKLFADHRGLVHVQVGVTTLDERVRKVFEPCAPTVKERFANLGALLTHEISAEARADPLIPELTDTDESFDALCGRIAETGCRQAVASHLFLRRANLGVLTARSGRWSFRRMASRLYTHEFDDFCGHGAICLPATDYRRERLARLKAVAAARGISLRLCRCTNPDVTDECCHPALPRQGSQLTQPPLFDA